MKENRNSALKFHTLLGVITLTVSKPHYNQIGVGLAFENPCMCRWSFLLAEFLLFASYFEGGDGCLTNRDGRNTFFLCAFHILHADLLLRNVRKTCMFLHSEMQYQPEGNRLSPLKGAEICTGPIPPSDAVLRELFWFYSSRFYFVLAEYTWCHENPSGVYWQKQQSNVVCH